MNWNIRKACVRAAALLAALTAALGMSAAPRAREDSGEYAARRAKLRAQVNGPVVLFGYTGQENSSPSYIFAQEENFYYLTGHNEPGAALLLIPEPPAGATVEGPREILYLPKRNPGRERWDGIRAGPDDPGVAEKSGFAAVMVFDELRGKLQSLAASFSEFHVLVAGQNAAGYPHRANWQKWVAEQAPQAKLSNVAGAIAALRQVKSPSEIKLMERVTEISMDAHLEAMKMIKPGAHEYEVAARMEWVHKRTGCEGEGYAPIVGAGFNSTVLHYNDVSARIQDGDVVVLDVGATCDGYVADITRTLPANGKFTPRQREIYEIVLGAQNAALAAIKPGMTMGRNTPNSLDKIARDYISAHGKDLKGESLGKYFIHGLGHHVGLNVHDVSAGGPLEPGMIVTIEPGVYIPEEKLGVRIEDIVLVTETGYKLLTARLPRTVADVERAMAQK